MSGYHVTTTQLQTTNQVFIFSDVACSPVCESTKQINTFCVVWFHLYPVSKDYRQLLLQIIDLQ